MQRQVLICLFVFVGGCTSVGDPPSPETRDPDTSVDSSADTSHETESPTETIADAELAIDTVPPPDSFEDSDAPPDTLTDVEVETETVSPPDSSTEVTDADTGPDVCVPSCNGRDCGSNDCNGVCGECAGGETCVNGVCESTAPPLCRWDQSNWDDGCVWAP